MHQPYQDQFFLLPNFSHITLVTFVRFESSHISKTMIFVFHSHTTKSQNLAKTSKSPNLAMHQPYQGQFLLPPNFSHITLEAFVRFESSHISKTMIFVFHLPHHQVTKSSQNTKITKLGLAPTIPRSISFAPKLFPHHFGGICGVWVQPHFQNQDFRLVHKFQTMCSDGEF